MAFENFAQGRWRYGGHFRAKIGIEGEKEFENALREINDSAAPPAVLVFANFLYASKHQFPQLARLPGDWEETATNSEEPGELPLLLVTPAAPV